MTLYKIFKSRVGASDIVQIGVSRPHINALDYEHFGYFGNEGNCYDFPLDYEGSSELHIYKDEKGNFYHSSLDSDYTYVLYKTLDGEDGCIMLTTNQFPQLYEIDKSNLVLKVKTRSVK